ncbi:MAG: thrC [Gammaproteobacteria bacterium]|jgi:threonine synthase|nr:thrC [Gammaproteobacteria bacterium]
MYNIIDFTTKLPVKPNGLVFAGENNPWEILMDLAVIKAKLNLEYFKTTPPCLLKYLPLMPIQKISEFVSLREVATPLVKSKTLGERLGLNLYFKIESKNPTGSFKDRGSAIDISVAKELGAKAIILASTGNMAASCACYAAAAKMPCYVLVPEGVPVAKLAQVIAFGGHIIQVKGTYNDAAELAKTIAEKKGFYLAGDYAYRVEGQKTAAFEIIDQLLFQAPDMVVIPIGCGTNITAYAKGFEEYRELGLLNTMPQLMGVQAQNAAAVVNSYNERKNTITPLESADTIASAIAVPNPIDGIKALHAIYSTKGSAVSVSDEEILQAQYLLSHEESLFVEGSAAATVAALIKTPQLTGLRNKTVICVLTGDGLKDSSIVLKAAIKPPTIYPDEKEFLQLYQSNFFNGKNMIFSDKSKILFQEKPSIVQIKEQLNKLLNAEYDDDYLLKIQSILYKILQKGKHITISDFQDSIQDALEKPRHPLHEIFSVYDFSVTAEKDRSSNATVKIKIGDTKKEAHGTGVGPVDAVINALRQACDEQINFKLTDYKVDIRHQGVDAVVYVELKLTKNNFSSLGRGTSPDIIQASIEAFEVAYNGFSS